MFLTIQYPLGLVPSQLTSLPTLKLSEDVSKMEYPPVYIPTATIPLVLFSRTSKSQFEYLVIKQSF
ncbi:MAG: hypothetical protein ACYDCN_13335 [Bacteroidia bacterium]